MSHIATLEASLSTLLGKSRDDPWSLLMIQTLLWSFRRWAIFYLTSDELTTTMAEFLWESHFDLADRFAPEGLRDFAIIWLNPANVGDRGEMLEELNEYFVEVVKIFDLSIYTNDDNLQNDLADFIDQRITVLIDIWLNGRSHYRIYPAAEESSETFSSEKVFEIMNSIMTRYITTATPPTPAARVAVPEAASTVPTPEAPAPEAPAPEPPAPEAPAPEPPAPEAPAPEAPTIAPTPEPPAPVNTIAAALNRRRTVRNHRIRIKEKMTRKNRGS